MKRVITIIALYLSLWHSLLAIACIILIYLTGVHISEALHNSSLYTFFNTEQAFLSWEPSRGEVGHYLLEITDTQLIGGGKNSALNSIRSTRHAISSVPSYRLDCFHNHSYQVRIKAMAPGGISSDYSEPSILFICDQESPKLSLAPLPSSFQKVRSQNITLTGSFDEPHLDTIVLNDTSATIDYQRNTFHAALTLTPGENTIDVSTRDLAGNVTTDRSVVTYAPITIISIPGNARLYWNGNYAYPGIYGGTAPRSYNHAGQHKQTLRVSFPGFKDFFGSIDFSDLSRDSYVISLIPHVPSLFTRLDTIVSVKDPPLPFSSPHPFVVDFNLDGHKDLLTGNANGTVSIFINRGSNAVPLLSDPFPLNTDGVLIDVGTNAAPFMVDYDNNGTFDLLVGNGEGLIYFYNNRGSNITPAFSTSTPLTFLDGIPIKVEGTCTPWVTDWNGDARKDLLLGGGNGTIMLSINEGSDSHPLFTALRQVGQGGDTTLRSDGPSAPCVVDWNADGDPDLLLGTGDGYVQVLYMTAGQKEPAIMSDEFIQYNGQTLMLDGAAAPFPVDWNEDGKTDLLIGSGGGTLYCLK